MNDYSLTLVMSVPPDLIYSLSAYNSIINVKYIFTRCFRTTGVVWADKSKLFVIHCRRDDVQWAAWAVLHRFAECTPYIFPYNRVGSFYIHGWICIVEPRYNKLATIMSSIKNSIANKTALLTYISDELLDITRLSSCHVEFVVIMFGSNVLY